MAESTRKTKFALVKETTEGVPVSPSSGDDFTALQEGFSFSPEFETLENAELQGTIGASAPTLGLESATGSFSHYLRHSGVEGQKPDFSLILESLFGISSETVNATERTTTTGSTAGDASTDATVVLAAGGTDFSRGFAIMLKDATNGRNIRNVKSESSDTLTLFQNLAVAPGTGINVGKCINYTPKDEGQPLSTWDYRGDGAAIQLISGTMFTDGTINIPATEAINMDFSLTGLAFYYNPIEITSSNKYIDFDDDGSTEVSAILTEKIYRDPTALAEEIQTKMDALVSDNITVSYSSSTGKFTIESDGATLNLLWNSGTNTANGAHTVLGYSSAADDTGATSYLADNAQDWSSPYSPSLDSENFLVAKNNEMYLGDRDDISCISTRTVTINFTKEAADQIDICQESGKSATIFNGRDITIDVVSYLQRHEVENFKRFRENQTVQWTYNAGAKDGAGNWIEGRCVNFFTPSAKISSFEVGDEDGIPVLNMTLTAFVSSGEDEFYMNFL